MPIPSMCDLKSRRETDEYGRQIVRERQKRQISSVTLGPGRNREDQTFIPASDFLTICWTDLPAMDFLT